LHRRQISLNTAGFGSKWNTRKHGGTEDREQYALTSVFGAEVIIDCLKAPLLVVVGLVLNNKCTTSIGIELAFTTDNVETVVAKALEAGALMVEPPRTKPWGQIVAYIRDIDGFLIEICTPIG
jgi:uncharacterized glyoxalase superfamily protein PhnB